MKRRSVLLFWLMMAVWAAMSAQSVDSSKYVEPSKKIFADPEVMPVYPGGQKALMAFVSDRVIPKLMKADSTLTEPWLWSLLSIKKVVAKISKCIVRKAQGLIKSLLEK